MMRSSLNDYLRKLSPKPPDIIHYFGHVESIAMEAVSRYLTPGVGRRDLVNASHSCSSSVRLAVIRRLPIGNGRREEGSLLNWS